jgi:DNA repair protein RadD
LIAVGPYTLRPDQEDAINALRSELARLRAAGEPPRVILQGVCGFGKTVVSSALISLMLAKGKTCAFLAHGRQLIFQKSNKLTECEIRHAVLMAGVGDEDLDGRYARALRGTLEGQSVVVASKDTYVARAYARDSVERFDVDVLIVDEAHIAMSEEWVRILTENAATVVIGLTATPALGNGKGLGGFYKGLVTAAGYEHLIGIGALVPFRVFAPYTVDMSGVKVQGNGEYSQPQAAKRFHTDALIGDVIENWRKYAEGRPTAVFAQSVKHSLDLAAQFNRAGIPAAHIDADSPQAEREDVFAGLETGRLLVACNYGVLRIGVDLPVLGCGQLACAMRSLTSYIQTVGRIARSCPSPHWHAGPKPDAVLIDHGGNVYRHGWPTEDREWSLDPQESVETRVKERKEREGFDGEVTCFKCGLMFDPRKAGKACPNCGAQKAKRGQRLRHADGTLEEVTQKTAKAEKTKDDQGLWLRMLGVCANNDWTVRVARKLFWRTRGYWPASDLEPMPGRHQTDQKVATLYPGFVRRKKETA